MEDSPRLTLNYGARFDVFNSSFDNENQLSPRVNLIYQPTDSTTLHAGYARYFTPPPVENVSGSTVARVRLAPRTVRPSPWTTPSRPSARTISTPASARRSATGLQVGLDGYYKRAKNQLDDGLFGQTLILSAFNYAKGEVYGVEFTALVHARRIFRPTPTSPTPWPRARTGTRRSSSSIRPTWPTSRTIGSSWITTRP